MIHRFARVSSLVQHSCRQDFSFLERKQSPFVVPRDSSRLTETGEAWIRALQHRKVARNSTKTNNNQIATNWFSVICSASLLFIVLFVHPAGGGDLCTKVPVRVHFGRGEGVRAATGTQYPLNAKG